MQSWRELAVVIYLFSHRPIGMLHDMLSFLEIEDKLLCLGKTIETATKGQLVHDQQKEIPEWLGADTCVTSNFSAVQPHPLDHDLVVRTIHATELTWLFFELRDTFAAALDAGNKYSFFGSLAQAAASHLALHQPEAEDHRPLLKSVLADAFAQLTQLRERGQISNPGRIVVHRSDAEGRQSREELDNE